MATADDTAPRWYRKLFFKIVIPVLLTFFVGAVATAIIVPDMQSRNIIDTAINNAEITAKQFKTLRKYYVENVIAKVLKYSSIKPSIEHKTTENTIPLPATMIHDMGALISEESTQVKLYSPFPFPNRANRQLDDFANEAWEFLRINPNKHFSRKVTENGKTKIRTAIADTMVNESCTGCHNSHPDTPKTGWKVGDVRGILEIDTDIDEQLAAGVATSNRVLLILATVSASVIVLIWMLLKVRINRPIQQAVSLADDVTASNFDTAVDISTEDEMSTLISSLVEMRDTLKEAAETDNRVTELVRINLALESVSSSVLLVNENHQIIYMNRSTEQLLSVFKGKDTTSRNFSAPQDLINSDITQIYNEDSNAVRTTLDKLTTTMSSVQSIGDHTLNVISTPIVDQQGIRLGTAVEWQDRTQELAVENEVQLIVKSALNGELQQRIDSSNKQGFLKVLSERVNELVDINQRVIEDTISVMSAVSKGDLTRKIDSHYKGSFDQLKNHINNTISKLTEVTEQINDSSNAVLLGSTEISNGNKNLSRRTEEQAASLEQTASSTEELTTSVRQNAESSKQASSLANNASELALSGSKVVGNAISAMSEITDSSRQIAAIIGVIDEIAFQTNLLALNAAVEAARAGEQGRGFAVVASEVRNLAGRSATAAREIKGLIEDSVNKVEEGSKLVDESNQTLESILGSVTKVSEIIAEIATASQEQSDGIIQINNAINQMDEMTQRNARLVKEAQIASESMDEQANSLTDLVGFFSTGRSIANSHHSVSVIDSPPATRQLASSENTASKSDRVPLKVVINDPVDRQWKEF